MQTHGLNMTLDLLIVGAGPAALVTLHEAKQAGLNAIAVDKGPVCGALVKHPTYMRWFSTADKLELAGFPLLVNEKNPTRREYLKYCRAFVKYFGLNIVTYREITSVQKKGPLFTVEAKDRYGRAIALALRFIHKRIEHLTYNPLGFKPTQFITPGQLQ